MPWFKELNDRLFRENKSFNVSRQKYFETKTLRELIVKTLYWGYNRGMRNNYHYDIFSKIENIENALRKLINSNGLTMTDYENFRDEIHKVRGIKLSTYSKLLYFLNIKFNNNPCLILNQRLIDVFTSKTYFEFQQLSGIRYENAEKNYLNFLNLTNKVADTLKTKGENIEQFLFIFGTNLKDK